MTSFIPVFSYARVSRIQIGIACTSMDRNCYIMRRHVLDKTQWNDIITNQYTKGIQN